MNVEKPIATSENREAAPEPNDSAVAETPGRKRRTADFIAAVLIGMVVIAFVLVLALFGEGKTLGQLEDGMSQLQATLIWYTLLCAGVLLPIWIPCLIISAFRGLKSGAYNVAGVTRSESPVAFRYVFVLYLTLALLGLSGIIIIALSFLKSINEV